MIINDELLAELESELGQVLRIAAFAGGVDQLSAVGIGSYLRLVTPQTVLSMLASNRTLLARIADLKQQIVAAGVTAENCEVFRKDAARLDWMINEVAVIHECIGQAGSRYCVHWPDADESQANIYKTEREAIDAAMEASQ